MEYVEKWGEVLKPYKNKTKRFLEIGLDKGVTLPMWKEYFQCEVCGIDITLENLQIDKEEYFLFEADSSKKESVELLGSRKFDVIVDDASPFLHWKTFQNFYPLLESGGIYIMETFKLHGNFLKVLKKIKTGYPDAEIQVTYSRLNLEAVLVIQAP